MTCIVIEDQPPAQRILQKYIDDIGTLELKAMFTDALQALAFLQRETVDLIFLDINLPKISGIDFLKTLTVRPDVILTTAFADYALESYELDVVDYLLKPFSFQRFVKAVAKAGKDLQPFPPTRNEKPVIPESLFVKSGYEHVKVVLTELLYIKSDAEYTELITLHKKHLSTEPLRYWREQLDEAGFVQVHKSYIINLAHVEKIATNHVYLNGGEEVPIGRAYKEGFMEKYVR
jgi:DNA-binding LytR/AlgR family response regulator